MARTTRTTPNSQKSPRKGDPTAANNQSKISRSLTRLLRHGAEDEKVPISPAGWVKMDDVLAWKGLSRIAPSISVSDIFEVVEEDGRTGKGRFGVRLAGGADGDGDGDDAAATGNMIVDVTASLSVTAADDDDNNPQLSNDGRQERKPLDPTSKNTPETQLAILHHTANPDLPLSTYLIRATQGHSMKTVQSADLLTPITLNDPSGVIPETVVHGTFYNAWTPILSSGGLRSMGRNNVHFATGPAFHDVLAIVGAEGDSAGANVGGPTGGGGGMQTKQQVESVLSQNKVISGMRWDAQLLIYIDLRRCLDDVARRGSDMKWWRSGNGVVLTEGVVWPPAPRPAEEGGEDGEERVVPLIASKHAKQQRASEIAEGQQSGVGDVVVPIIASTQHAKAPVTAAKPAVRLVPMEYWRAVVDIKGGLGVVWTREDGVVRELPENLRNMGAPRGKGRVHGSNRGRGGGKGKPRLNVRDEVDALTGPDDVNDKSDG